MEDGDPRILAALTLLEQRLTALRHVSDLGRSVSLGRQIEPFRTWEATTARLLWDQGLRREAIRIGRLSYMGSGDPVLDIGARIGAAGQFLEDLGGQLRSDPSMLELQLRDVQREREGLVASNPRRVAVVHGRDHHARDGIFEFLSSLDLKPVEWNEAIRQTGKGAPHRREILDALFGTTQAVLVILTPDEHAMLRPDLHSGDAQPRTQARPNVWLEAGMALVANSDRTILVRFPQHAEASDIDGLQYVNFDGASASRQELRTRLETAGCAVNVADDRWLRAGQERIDASLVAVKRGFAEPSLREGELSPEQRWELLRPLEQALFRDVGINHGWWPINSVSGDLQEYDVRPPHQVRQDLMQLIEPHGLLQRRENYPEPGRSCWELSARGRSLWEWARTNRPRSFR